MTAYAPRHATARPRLTPVLLATLDAAVLAVAVLALVLTLTHASGTPATAPRAPVSAPAAQTTTPAPRMAPRPAAARPRPYVVQPGDTLWSVSAWYYGTGGDWHRIYAANRAVIGSNPDLIRPGQRLTLPPVKGQ